MTRRAVNLLLTAVLLSGSLMTEIPECQAQDEIRTLLNKYCLGCHGQTDAEAGISLISADSIRAGGESGPILHGDDLTQSPLYQVLQPDAENPMPPADEPQPTEAERQALQKWVLAGAPLTPGGLMRPDVPDVEPRQPRAERLLSSLFLSDQDAIAVSGTQTVSLLDRKTRQSRWQTESPIGAIAQLNRAHQHPWLVAAGGVPGVGGVALLISVEDGTILKQFAGHADSVYAAVLTADDQILATAGYDRRILLHDVQSGQVLRTLEGHNGSVFDLAFSPDGSVLCSASADGTVKVWRTADGQRLDTLSQPQAEQYAVLVSPDGHRVYAAGADNRIRIWQLVSLQKAKINPLQVARFAHEQAITNLALSADGRLLASAAEDRTLRIWRTNPLTHLQALPQQSAVVSSASFLSDSELFVTRLDGTTEILPIVVQPESDQPTHSPATDSPQPVPVQAAPQQVTETEPNNNPSAAQQISVPAVVSGRIATVAESAADDTDIDQFRFQATAGQSLVLEVRAQRDQSPLDSVIQVLNSDGERILQTRLQAVRDSWFTFRGKDSDTSDDFRVFNWEEMELNDYLYADGEVVRLWLYPRGPDSGFKVYPGSGNRHSWFGTTATAHALQAPCFIVVPRGPDEPLTENGLPVFPVYFENDDDPLREWGQDSRLMFTAPADGEYIVQIADARGFSGDDHTYQLFVRPPAPDFQVTVSGRRISVAPDTGQELAFTARRIDGYTGPIEISVDNLPPGFASSGPTTIEQDQQEALLTVYATSEAVQPTPEQVQAVRLTASAQIGGQQVAHELPSLEQLQLSSEPKLKIRILRAGSAGDSAGAEPLQRLIIHPGETVQAQLLVERSGHDGIVSFGKEESGRNLPHGVFVDNIGLNGLLLLEGQTQREFFITAAPIVTETTRTFFLKSSIDGITSLPVTLEVRQRPEDRRGLAQAATDSAD